MTTDWTPSPELIKDCLNYATEEDIFKELDKRHEAYIYVCEAKGKIGPTLCNPFWNKGSRAMLLGLLEWALLVLRTSYKEEVLEIVDRPTDKT